MAKKEDGEIGNYTNDGLQSDNESDDDLFPITTKKCTRKKKPRQRKRSASLPFIENHTGLVAAKGLQLVKAKDNRQGTWTGIREGDDESEFEDGMTDMNKTLGEQGSTRRSSSMPEFYNSSQRRKDEPSKRYATKSGGSRQRNKRLANETDFEQKEEESFKLPVISNCVSSKSTQEQSKEIETLSQTAENMKIQRKTYLPRINSNNGSVFMKSR